MKYDDSNAEDSDALEGMTIKVIKPTDSAGTEGKIVIEFSSTTPKKLKGTLVDLWFNLTGNATTGQQFNISMTVDELRNGSTNLTSEVETASMVAQPDGEERKKKQKHLLQLPHHQQQHRQVHHPLQQHQVRVPQRRPRMHQRREMQPIFRLWFF